MTKILRLEKLDCALGTLLIVADGAVLYALDYADYGTRMHKLLSARFPDCKLEESAPGELSARLQAYLDGDFAALNGLAVEPGGTPFQQKVWRALRQIPAGAVWSYGELAEYLGTPTAARAVGYANSLNPIAIVLPCHRVVGVNGSLTGYAGGIERKRWLLQHEGVNTSRLPTFGMLLRKLSRRSLLVQLSNADENNDTPPPSQMTLWE
jgi:methylated-DNA-[protein]-cysteine S-methyltransferase